MSASGSRFSDQSAEVRAYYTSLWGAEAETRWSADQARRVYSAPTVDAESERRVGLAPIQLSPAAKRALVSLLEAARRQGDKPSGLRLRAELEHDAAGARANGAPRTDAAGLASLDVTPVSGPMPSEDIFQWDDLLLYLDPLTADQLAGSRITLEDGGLAIEILETGRRQRAAYSSLPAPGVFASYGHARDILGAYFGPLLLVGLVQLALAVPGVLVVRALGPQAGRALYELLVSNPLGYGGLYAVLRAVRDERVTAAQTLYAFRSLKRYAWSVLAAVLIWMLPQAVPLFAAVVHPIAGIVLSVISWAVVTVRLSFVPYLVIDEELSPIDAVVESWRRSAGHVWRIVGVYAMAVPVMLLGFIALFVGIIPAAVLVVAAHGTLFAAITAQTRRWLTRPER